jgi:hypothetical protein
MLWVVGAILEGFVSCNKQFAVVAVCIHLKYRISQRSFCARYTMAVNYFANPPPGLDLTESRTATNNAIGIVLFVLSLVFVVLRLVRKFDKFVI